MKKTLLFIAFSCWSAFLFAQVPKKKTVISDDQPQSQSNSSGVQPITDISTTPKSVPVNSDSLGFEHRNDAKDSITIFYKLLDGIKRFTLDSSIHNFDSYFSVPSSYAYLGNNGAAASSLIYLPNERIGFDPGFHAFDIYMFTLENIRFYKTTKPFSSLSYQLASGKEQMLKANHTQSPTSNFNFGFDYKLISAPGFFITQNTNHNSFSLFGNYQGKRKRYQSFFTMLGNTIKASENGGIENKNDLADPNKKDRFTIPVNLGNNANFRNNPFVTTIFTGNEYKNFNVFYRQTYDLGKKDSIIINDSTVNYVFYPRLRFQHSFSFNTQSFQFRDIYADSTIYASWFQQHLENPTDTFQLATKWKTINNDFTLLQFPDIKNQSQFFAAGISVQNIIGNTKNQTSHFNNLLLHGVYQNRTRNKLWDLMVKGTYYLGGLNNGDYAFNSHLFRVISPKSGTVSIFFNNINRTPSFIFDNRSLFHLGVANDFKKENISAIGAEWNHSKATIKFSNTIIVNHSFFYDYINAEQWNKAINLLQLTVSKKTRIYKNYFWYVDMALQQVDKSTPIRVPLLYTRNRLALEGKFYRNLELSAGVDIRYFTAYYANGYSPILGQFFKQDSFLLSNLPDISTYAHFRIKGFAGFLRAENLNTLSFSNGIGFTRNNFAAPLYPTQGLMIRFGIQWWFVN